MAALSSYLAGASGSDVCSPTVTFTNNYAGLVAACGKTGSANVTFTGKDACGNAATGSSLYRVVDTTGPTVNAPVNKTVECDGAGNVAALNTYLAGSTGSDACSLGAVTFTNDYKSLVPACGKSGSATVKFTGKDDCGNTTTTSSVFATVDTTAPTVKAAPNKTAECDGVGNVADLNGFLAGPTGTDVCSNGVSFINDYAGLAPACGRTGAATVKFTGKDDCGNAASATAQYTLIDTTAPTVKAPANKTVECDGSGNGGDLGAFLTAGSGTDTCSPTVNVKNDFVKLVAACGKTGASTVKFTGTDECGNSASASAAFAIVDTTAPTVTPPPSKTVECDGAGNVAQLSSYLANVAGSDACSSTVALSNDFVKLTPACGKTGAANVKFTGKDECGNTASGTTAFTIIDTTAPIVKAPANAQIECDGGGNVAGINAFLGAASGTDVCSAAVTFTNDFTKLSPACGKTGSASVKFTGKDECGNAASTTAVVTVVDTTPPVVKTPANTNVECDGAGNVAGLNAFLAGATGNDACSAAVSFTNDFANLTPACGKTGSAAVKFTGKDECGNTAAGSATFAIVDTTGPTVKAPAATQVECDGAGNVAGLNAFLAGPSGTDVCSAAVSFTNDFVKLAPACGKTGAATVKFTGKDECGNTSSASAPFAIIDTTPPAITLPANTAVECDGAGNVAGLNAFLAGPSGSDICSAAVTFKNDFVKLTPACGKTGAAAVKFTGTDECGNSAAGSAEFSIVDTTPPALKAPVAAKVECDGAGNVAALNAFLAGASGADTCSAAVSFSNDFLKLNPACGKTGAASVKFTGKDECGNSAVVSSDFTVVDTTAPVVKAPANKQVECDGGGNVGDVNAFLASVAGSDVCSAAVSFTNDFTKLSPACGKSGAATVTFTGKDECGNTAMGSAAITVVDTTPPAIKAPANTNVECDGAGNVGALNAFLVGPSGSDVCSAAVSFTNDFVKLAPACGKTGGASVKFTGKDECGNTAAAAAAFNIVDTTPPAIKLPANTVVECDGAGNNAQLGAFLVGATGADVCSSAVSFKNDFLKLTPACGKTGAAAVKFTGTDECGNSAAGLAQFSIVDSTPPAVKAPAAVVVECDGAGNNVQLNAFLAGAAGADSCSAAVAFKNDFVKLTPACGKTGAAAVTFTGTDECGNTAADASTFTIVDTTPPSVKVPADLVVECDGKGNLTDVNAFLAAVTGADVCSNKVTITSNYKSLAPLCGKTGAATVTFTVTDECGNSATGTANVKLVDTTPPVVTAPANAKVECDGQGNAAQLSTFLGGATGADVCSAQVSLANDFQALTPACGKTAGAAVKFTGTDECGNSASASARFDIVDTTPPTLTVPANKQVECDGAGNVGDVNAFLGSIAGSDVCSANVAYSNDYNALTPACGKTGAATVKFTGKDECGNSASGAAKITVVDTTPPALAVPPAQIAECTGGGVAQFKPNGASGSDICGNVSVVSPGLAAYPLGDNTLSHSVTDACGNVTKGTSNLKVVDTTPPVISCPPVTSVECNGQLQANVMPPAATTSDVCISSMIVAAPAAGSYPFGNTVTKYVARDQAGLESSCTSTIAVVDTTPAQITCAAPIVAECTGNLSAGVYVPAPTFFDLCDNTRVLVKGPAGAGVYPLGATPVTFSANDVGNNVSSCQTTVTVVDTRKPAVTCPPNVNIECTGVGQTVFTPLKATATDTCSSVVVNNPGARAFPLGPNTVNYSATDTSGNIGTCSSTVTVRDSQKPTVVSAAGGYAQTLAGNGHAMFNVNVVTDCQLAINDVCSGVINPANASVTIGCVTSDENVVGPENTTPDIVVTGLTTVQLRNERDDNGDGRVYHINFTVKDPAGNVGNGVCNVRAPIDANNPSVVDSGVKYTVCR